MKTPEIFTQHLSSLWSLWGEVADHPRWEDVGLAQQGLKPEYKGFIEYVFSGDPGGRRNFYAGLFMDIMSRPEVLAWIRCRRLHGHYCKAIETMVQMAVEEWKDGQGGTDASRAKLFGVCRGTWAKKYKLMYNTIMATPASWELEIMQIVNKRLR